MLSLASISDAIPAVRTPLALAALLLLIGAPVLRSLLRRESRPNQDTKAIIRYGFILGLVFGVMAIASFVYTAGFNREIRISGTVRDETGSGLGQVSVQIAGRDGGMTDDRGTFAFTVADARGADGYLLDVFLSGYTLEHVSLEGRYPQPVAIVLKKAPVSLTKLIALPGSMVLRHNLGVPQVEVSVIYANPFPKDVMLTEISATLVSPTGTRVPLTMEGTWLPPVPFGPPLTLWTLGKEDSVALSYSFFNTNQRFFEVQRKVFDELGPKITATTLPDPSVALLSAGLVSDLRQFMDSQFIWVPGKWELVWNCNVQGQAATAKSSFVLNQATVTSMRAIEKYYSSALGVAPGWRFWQTADANPTAIVTLTNQ